MVGLIVILVPLICGMIAMLCFYFGGKLVRRSLTRSKPGLPPARIANLTGAERDYERTVRAFAVVAKLWRPAALITGLAMIAFALALTCAIMGELAGMS